MSILDIIIISLGAGAVIIYAVFSILGYKKDQAKIKEYVKQGYTYEKAKELVKKQKQKGKKSNKDQEDDDLAE